MSNYRQAVYSVSYDCSACFDNGVRYFETYDDAKEFSDRYEISGYSVRMRETLTDAATANAMLMFQQPAPVSEYTTVH